MTAQDIIERIRTYPIAVVCVVIALILFGVYYFRGSAVPLLGQTVADMEKERDTLSSNRKNAIRLSEDLSKLEGLIDQIESRVLMSEDRSTNAKYFYKVESNYDVEMLSISQLGRIAPDSKVKLFGALKKRAVVPFNITIEGSYTEALMYMDGISNGEKLGRIRNMTLASTPSLDGKVNLQMRIDMLGEQMVK